METVGLGLFYEDLPIGRTFRTIGRGRWAMRLRVILALGRSRLEENYSHRIFLRYSRSVSSGAAGPWWNTAPREAVPLHGDLHHDNVLDFGPRGWLAIDPRIAGLAAAELDRA